ncbi:MAG TPA: META domain-containing protein, partial [Stenomitos sp.]
MQDFKSKKSQRYAMQRYGWTIGLAASVLAAVRLLAADSAVAVADPIFLHSQGQVVQMADAQPDSLMAHVEGKRWQLVSLQDTQGKATKAIGTVTLEFAGSSVSGTGGCNRFRAPYVSEGGSQIRISAILSTRMACADPAMSAQEGRFFSALQSAQSLMFDSQGQLAIRYRSASGGEATLIFAADSEGSQPQSLSLNGTAWQLTAWQQGTTPKSLVADTPITVTFTGDRISGS